MNDTLKKALVGIGSFFACLAAILLHKRSATEDVRGGIAVADAGIGDAEGAVGRAGDAVEGAERAVADCERGVAKLGASVGRVEASVERSESILEQVRQQKIEDGGDSGGV